MTEKKTKLKPSMNRRENIRGVIRIAHQSGDDLAKAKPGRTYLRTPRDYSGCPHLQASGV